MNPHAPGGDEREEPEEIIEDLESIKNLLDDPDATAGEPGADSDVPLLDDPVEEGLTIDEGMADDTFKTLLGDAWQDSVEDLFKQARARIEERSTAWRPEDTDDLAQALKIRIDASVRAWLAETLEANIGLLRERIVAELSAELITHLQHKLDHGHATENQGHDHG